ncbi:MAG: hypothetical protein A2Y62_02890 [Candidatus Fischerbacteria bacterium RBG_13_37_8]|uniref:Uncharacterized protein n=1 Tax=Candidatus Fischerbacteria bacterium RBG_13_37_8 TaxID=1817863 RepID=A0A1F5VXS3_9BACT|nr:MAG: hypothetical protein A2Y62_02890 [Candidatus Fischerbacteria bacterium RBG_13_37_8]
MALKYEITVGEKLVSIHECNKLEPGFISKREAPILFFQRNLHNFGRTRQIVELSVCDFIELLQDGLFLIDRNKSCGG